MRAVLTIAGLSLLTGQAVADDVAIEVGIPRLDVAEYHRPYVAIWIANPDHSVVSNLAVWYQQGETGEGKGETWLKDIRQWWRRTGRELAMPVDGVSGPTKAPGTHEIVLPSDKGAFGNLKPGNYQLVVEAAREVGGRELVSVPFTWPLKGEALSTSGERELGKVTLRLAGK
ncbi:MAG: DUF2271 domain-containing protein [Alphaproteobacteria bacterium HGW-Alphaproteobacteria-18]|nr:MAG: DUF2271 domain-containing protein [Alphaproteobacteria bacterium HGW-Alphaproteobacteria-18]